MIEISHAQARRLIRESLDRPADWALWSALQAHLETCAACSEYRAAHLALERGLIRALHARPEHDLAESELPQSVTDTLRQRAARRRLAARAGLALLAVILLTGFGLYWRTVRPAASAEIAGAVDTATPFPTVTPTAWTGDFNGRLVLEAYGPDGSPDVFLLNQGADGPDLINLTNHPAIDTAPIWSPDGQWIAFISDRDGLPPFSGVGEIYVMTIAGTRLTRLTADPGISWLPRISWSADGRWIAAVGVSADRPEGMIYMISLRGEGLLRPVPGSLGARYPTFSPRESLLAYLALGGETRPDSIHVYDTEYNLSKPVLTGDLPKQARLALDGALDWSPDGRSLSFTALGPFAGGGAGLAPGAVSQVRSAYSLSHTLAAGPDAQINSYRVLSVPGNSPLLSAGYSPQGELLYVQAGVYGESCPGVFGFSGTSPLAGTAPAGLVMPVLCLESGLERASWTQDGQWLLMSGRMYGEETSGLYALRIPDLNARYRDAITERLADLPAGAQALRVRPEQAQSSFPPFQKIDPQPGRAPAADARPPDDLLARALTAYSTGREGVRRTITGLSSSGLVELDGGRLGYCPRPAPDGTKIAYISSKVESDIGPDALFVMDANGKRPVQVSNYANLTGEAFWGQTRVVSGLAGCPAWSPDGERLAVYVNTDKRLYLAVFPALGDTQPARFVALPDANPFIAPRWTLDGRRIAVARTARTDMPPRIVAVDPETGEETPLEVSDDWKSIGDLRYSPDGRHLVYLARRIDAEGLAHTELRVVSLTAGGGVNGDKVTIPLPPYPAESSTPGYGGLTWLRGGRPGDLGLVGLVVPGRRPGMLPSSLLTVDLETLRIQFLPRPDDNLRSAAWLADAAGTWVIYSTDSGVWSLNVGHALSGETHPSWIGFEAVDELVWGGE